LLRVKRIIIADQTYALGLILIARTQVGEGVIRVRIHTLVLPALT
jgi:hypothetical protein